jgi:hypothetical protein
MDTTRRSLVAAGLVSMPLAALGPRLFGEAGGGLAAPAQQEGRDLLAEYLIAETKRNCALAQIKGRGRSAAWRALGANLEVTGAYVLSRKSSKDLRRAVAKHGNLPNEIHDLWAELVPAIETGYGVQVKPQLDAQAVATAVRGCERFGFPRLRRARLSFEAQADRIDEAEGRGAVIAAVRQTPGNDFGPWAIGTGDPIPMTCSEVEILMGAIACVCAIFPELRWFLEPILAALQLATGFACSD